MQILEYLQDERWGYRVSEGTRSTSNSETQQNSSDCFFIACLNHSNLICDDNAYNVQDTYSLATVVAWQTWFRCTMDAGGTLLTVIAAKLHESSHSWIYFDSVFRQILQLQLIFRTIRKSAIVEELTGKEPISIRGFSMFRTERLVRDVTENDFHVHCDRRCGFLVNGLNEIVRLTHLRMYQKSTFALGARRSRETLPLIGRDVNERKSGSPATFNQEISPRTPVRHRKSLSPMANGFYANPGPSSVSDYDWPYIGDNTPYFDFFCPFLFLLLVTSFSRSSLALLATIPRILSVHGGSPCAECCNGDLTIQPTFCLRPVATSCDSRPFYFDTVLSGRSVIFRKLVGSSLRRLFVHWLFCGYFVNVWTGHPINLLRIFLTDYCENSSDHCCGDYLYDNDAVITFQNLWTSVSISFSRMLSIDYCGNLRGHLLKDYLQTLVIF